MLRKSLGKSRHWVRRVSDHQIKHCALGDDHWADVYENVENQQYVNLSIHLPKPPAHKIIKGWGAGALYVSRQGEFEEVKDPDMWIAEVLKLRAKRGTRKTPYLDKRLKNRSMEDALRFRKDEPGIQKLFHTMSPPDGDYLSYMAQKSPEFAKDSLTKLKDWSFDVASSFEEQTGRPVLAFALHLDSRIPHVDLLSCTTDQDGDAIPGLGSGPGLVGPDNSMIIRQAMLGIVPDNCGSVRRALLRRKHVRYGAKWKSGYERKGRGREPVDVLLHHLTDQWVEVTFGNPILKAFRMAYTRDFRKRVSYELAKDINARLAELHSFNPDAYKRHELPLDKPMEPADIYNSVTATKPTMTTLPPKPFGTINPADMVPVAMEATGAASITMAPAHILTGLLDSLEKMFEGVEGPAFQPNNDITGP